MELQIINIDGNTALKTRNYKGAVTSCYGWTPNPPRMWRPYFLFKMDQTYNMVCPCTKEANEHALIHNNFSGAMEDDLLPWKMTKINKRVLSLDFVFHVWRFPK